MRTQTRESYSFPGDRLFLGGVGRVLSMGQSQFLSTKGWKGNRPRILCGRERPYPGMKVESTQGSHECYAGAYQFISYYISNQELTPKRVRSSQVQPSSPVSKTVAAHFRLFSLSPSSPTCSRTLISLPEPASTLHLTEECKST